MSHEDNGVCLSEDDIAFSDPQGTYAQKIYKGTSVMGKRAKQQFKGEYVKSRSNIL